MDELLIQLSAYCDGELDGVARAEIERRLSAEPAKSEWPALLAQFQRLDREAAALPVPLAENAAKLASLINPALPQSSDEIERGLREHPLPARIQSALDEVHVAPDERFNEGWSAISARIAAMAEERRAADARTLDAADHTPRISDEKWSRVWKKIQQKVARAQAISRRKLPEPTPESLRGPRRRSFWVACGSVAAILTLAIGVRLAYQAEREDSVQTELPSRGSDRYEVSIEYAGGDAIVCYYLKH